MYNSQVIVCQHHGIFIRVCVVCIDLCMSGIMMSCHVDCFFTYGIGYRCINFMFHCKINNFYNILESRFSTHLRYFTVHMLFHIYQLHIIYINCSEFEQCIFYILYCVNLDLLFFSKDLYCLFHTVCITDNNRSASVIHGWICECFYRYFGSVSRRIAHCNSYDWFLCHCPLPFITV